MFDIGWDEMALIAVISLVVIGPKDLPKVMRQVGRWTRKARELASEFQRGVDEMVREAELKEMKEKVESATGETALRAQITAALDADGTLTETMTLPPKPLADTPKPAAATEATQPPAPAIPAHNEEQPVVELPQTAPFETPHRPPEP